MLVFLINIHDAVDKESSNDIIALHTDFSQAFDKVLLLRKLSQIDVAGCFLEVISDFIDQRKQCFRVDKTSPQIWVLQAVYLKCWEQLCCALS